MFLKFIILTSSLFLLAACQSDQVAIVEEQINQVTLDSESDTEKIREARLAFDELGESDQKLVTNYKELLAAEDLLDKQMIDEVVVEINNIGPINVNSDELIAKARTAFEALSREQQKHVPNLKTLLDAESKYTQTLTDTAQKLVASMKNLTVNDYSVVDEFQTVYNKLSEKQIIELSDDIQSPDELISTFKINLLDKQISSVNYTSGEPNESQVERIFAMVKSYNDLSQNEIKSLVNKKQFDDTIKEYKEYFNDREKKDRLYKRQNFIKLSTTIPYTDLLKFPESYKDQKVALEIEILEIHKGNIITADYFIVKDRANQQDLYHISDQREVKEPILSVGDTLTIFGEYKKLGDYVVYSDKKGLLNTNFNREKLEEYSIPVIDLNYSSVDNLGIIAANNPLLSITIDEELEIMKKELYDFIKDIK